MVFNGSILYVFIFLIIFLWLGLVSYLLFKSIRHYNNLIGQTHKDTLIEVLNQLLSQKREIIDQAQEIQKHVRVLEQESKIYIQRVGIVRFNPFSDTGGSQSFSLALLDGLDNGIVMTSLYARTGNRWYVKHVKAGKGVDIELSKEEQTAINHAKHLSDINN